MISFPLNSHFSPSQKNPLHSLHCPPLKSMFIPGIFNHVFFPPQNAKDPPHSNLTHLSRFNENSIAVIKSSSTFADDTESSLITIPHSLAHDHKLLSVSSTLGVFPKLTARSQGQGPAVWLCGIPTPQGPGQAQPKCASNTERLTECKGWRIRWTWRLSRPYRWHNWGKGRLMSLLSSRVILFGLCKESGWGTTKLFLAGSVVRFFSKDNLRH